ncbi:hypothetical protein D0868_02476 [Hortaea werneckii]|uniref:Uncharacterized protein n=1 Tax=Hortaea werneckii TaxID=91943 RepID=A0A3M6ZB85_HORWE|nr:hypothetical protein KC330_g7197 [Hortaea werneckii]RMY12605.1 hypothetical protein D0868_02476 [Hortaea werneckii]
MSTPAGLLGRPNSDSDTPAPAPAPTPAPAPASTPEPLAQSQTSIAPSEGEEMSYAAAARKGPEQSDEEKIPDTVPEIAHSDSGVHSLESLNSADEHLQTISYADQQKAAEQAAADAHRAGQQVSQDAKDFGRKAETDAQRLEAQAAQKYQELSKEAKKEYDAVKSSASKNYKEFKKEAGVEMDKAEREAREAEEWAAKNKKNPVVVGNVVVIGALAALLSAQAYRMQKAGTLTWKVAGAWAGVVGLFGVGDYFVSQWLFKNKYPPKK